MLQPSSEPLSDLLGEWEGGISLSVHALHLVLEQSSDRMEWYLPHPGREMILFARPQGFQLSCVLPYNQKGDYALLYNKLEKIHLLPTYTMQHKPVISFKYVLLSVIGFILLGAMLQESPFVLLWIILGIHTGILLSYFFKRRYRQNLLMVYDNDGQKTELLFSVADKKQCIPFFEQYAGEIFGNGSD